MQSWDPNMSYAIEICESIIAIQCPNSARSKLRLKCVDISQNVSNISWSKQYYIICRSKQCYSNIKNNRISKKSKKIHLKYTIDANADYGSFGFLGNSFHVF